MENNNINETDITNKFANILSDGCRTIRPELKQAWYQTVIKSLQKNSNINDFNYQLASFTAAVKCMQSLSNESDIEDAYDLIDTQTHPCVFNDQSITDWQNYYVSKLILIFHERGLEFSKYRSERIKAKQR